MIDPPTWEEVIPPIPTPEGYRNMARLPFEDRLDRADKLGVDFFS